MQIQDIYGNFIIKEKVLLELIRSEPLQRLKDIAQAGISKYYLKNRNKSRYEHSLGVMLFLKYFDAPLEEQIAGLIHDVSHTAFSHVVDFVFENKEHNYHEELFEEVIFNSDIPRILRKYGFSEDVFDVENSEKFPLLEQNIPEICADRFDYSVRDSFALKVLSKQKIKDYLKSLVVIDNKFIFTDKDIVLDFAENFFKIYDTCYNSLKEVALYKLFADILKDALNKSIISEDDFFKNRFVCFK